MSVLKFLENAVNKHPEKTALKDENHSVSYAEVNELSDRIATSLIDLINTENRPIAVLIDRNVESLVAFIGITKSHNFYMPVDYSQPVNRIINMVTQMEPACVIAFNNCSEEIRERISAPVYEYEELIKIQTDVKLLREVREKIKEKDPLYLMCTSGSTGIPKGVLITHDGVERFITTFVETFGFNENDVFGNQAPFDFDVSVKDFYSTLYCGATMVIIPRKCFSMPKLLVEVLDENRITVIIWAVSALCIVAGINAFKSRVPSHIRKVLFSGEVMPVKMLNVWRQYLPEAMYVNLYGPTEVTCNCTYYIVDREFNDEEKLPLGKVFDNCSVYVLDDRNERIKTSETGEICVSGPSVSPGYYHNEQKTADVFVSNPFVPETLMYRTGDLAYFSPDGYYYFAGRKDFQIKHMGHRIELEEIEKYLNAAQCVSRAICLYDEKRNKLVTVYQGEADKKDIIAALKNDIPKYMIPSVYYQEETLPLTKNGKIDRKQLFEKFVGE